MKTIQKITATFLLLFSTQSLAASLDASDPQGERFPISRPVAISRPAPVSMSADLAANRARLLDALHDYAVAGDFPQNSDTPGRKQMYFLDPQGRACAVAHLMIVSGRLADVQNIAATNNAVKVTRNVSGPIADWIRTSGFTVDEIMMIQEPDGYSFMQIQDPVPVVRADRERIQKRLLSVERRLRASSTITAGLSAS